MQTALVVLIVAVAAIYVGRCVLQRTQAKAELCLWLLLL